MGIYDRDYMRASRDERPSWLRNRREPISPLWWIVGILIVLSIARYVYVNWNAIRHLPGVARVVPIPAAPAAEAARPATSERNPFPDDPTWHTGPRPSVERAEALEPRPPVVFKCARNGTVTYSASPDCAGGAGTSLTIHPGSEPQPVTAKAPHRYAAPSVEQPAPVVIVNNTSPTVDTKRMQCDALEQEINALDSAARQPQGPQMQDMLRQQRQRVRSKQAELRC
jgi:hypothetical protein